MKITYFVSGYMRCGTSMMMDALTAGGLDPAFNSVRDEMNDKFGDKDYKPNPNGFYELSKEEYKQAGFPRGYEGKLIKLLLGGINKIVAGDYKVVFMRRDYEEIRQSFEGFFNQPLGVDRKSLTAAIENTIGILQQRRDVSLTVIDYRDVVEKPLDVFGLLHNKGWPIDTRKAAATVDPKLYRFRIEDLDEGI